MNGNFEQTKIGGQSLGIREHKPQHYHADQNFVLDGMFEDIAFLIVPIKAHIELWEAKTRRKVMNF